MKYVPYQEQQGLIDAAIAEFPSEFGLRAFPGKRFYISRGASYWSDNGGPMLYTYTAEGLAFAKGTVEELKREVVRIDIRKTQNMSFDEVIESGTGYHKGYDGYDPRQGRSLPTNESVKALGWHQGWEDASRRFSMSPKIPHGINYDSRLRELFTSEYRAGYRDAAKDLHGDDEHARDSAWDTMFPKPAPAAPMKTTRLTLGSARSQQAGAFTAAIKDYLKSRK